MEFKLKTFDIKSIPKPSKPISILIATRGSGLSFSLQTNK